MKDIKNHNGFIYTEKAMDMAVKQYIDDFNENDLSDKNTVIKEFSISRQDALKIVLDEIETTIQNNNDFEYVGNKTWKFEPFIGLEYFFYFCDDEQLYKACVLVRSAVFAKDKTIIGIKRKVFEQYCKDFLFNDVFKNCCKVKKQDEKH